MADFSHSKSLFSGKYREPSTLQGNLAYAIFVLFCLGHKSLRFWFMPQAYMNN